MNELILYGLILIIGWLIGIFYSKDTTCGGANPLDAPTDIQPDDIKNPTE